MNTVFWRRTVLAVESETLRSALRTAHARSAQLSAQLAAAGGGSGDAEVPSSAAIISSSGSSEALYLDVLTKYDAAAKAATEEATRSAREGKVRVCSCGVLYGSMCGSFGLPSGLC